jgi:DNA-binding MarR family transcriptional regulator
MSIGEEPLSELSFALTREVRDTCFCLHAQRTARAIARRYDQALRPLGLTNGQFSLLMSLNRPMPPTIAEVAALLAMDRTTVTANIKPLERRGLLTSSVDADDRRSRRMRLTPAGRELLIAALPLWRQAQAATAGRAAGTNPGQLRDALSALA